MRLVRGSRRGGAARRARAPGSAARRAAPRAAAPHPPLKTPLPPQRAPRRLEADDIPVATGLPRAGRRKRFVRRRLSAGLSSPMMRSNTTADYTTEELVMGPNSTPLAGCLPAELAQLAKKRDIPELEALVELMDARDPKGARAAGAGEGRRGRRGRAAARLRAGAPAQRERLQSRPAARPPCRPLLADPLPPSFSRDLPLPPPHTHAHAVYGTCEETASKMMMKCGEAEERKACADAGICEWDADTKECYISQAPMMAALLGDKSRTAEAARTCRDILTAGPCNGAGTVEFDLRRARHLLPNPAAVARALSGQKSVRLQQ